MPGLGGYSVKANARARITMPTVVCLVAEMRAESSRLENSGSA
jgi:hypothetical protein